MLMKSSSRKPTHQQETSRPKAKTNRPAIFPKAPRCISEENDQKVIEFFFFSFSFFFSFFLSFSGLGSLFTRKNRKEKAGKVGGYNLQ